MKKVHNFKTFVLEHQYKLSTWTIKYSIIGGTFRTTEVTAYDYQDSLREFERKIGMDKSSIISSQKWSPPNPKKPS